MRLSVENELRTEAVLIRYVPSIVPRSSENFCPEEWQVSPVTVTFLLCSLFFCLVVLQGKPH